MRRGGNDSRILSYGFVTFEEKDAAEIAQQALHGFMLGGRKLRLTFQNILFIFKFNIFITE